MDELKRFGKKLSEENSKAVDRAIALLWFFQHMQTFESRSARDLANDLHTLGFPRANVSRLASELGRSPYTIKTKLGHFKIDARKTTELDSKYNEFIKKQLVPVSDAVIPKNVTEKTRPYLEKIVTQINGSYDNQWYDCTAVLCRRLMESLIIECYIAHGVRAKIELPDGSLKMLEALIPAIKNETTFKLARDSGKSMDLIKKIGDTAAHNRNYITSQQDIDDIKLKIRPLINDLLILAKIKT